MVAEWYYARNKQKFGPLTETQLKELVRSGELSATDMVWKQGMAKWMQVSQVEGLIEASPQQAAGSSVPPPLPPPVPVAVWYYVKDGQRAGPVTDAHLKQLADSGAVARSDMVWKHGMATWTQAGLVEGLFSVAPPPAILASVPPALATATPQAGVAKEADSPEQKALTHLTKAQRLSDKGKFRPAIAEFTAATRPDPSLWKAFLGRGEAYYLVDEHEKAIADYTEAIRLNAECGEAYRERALVYLQEGNNVRAAADASKAISLLPQDAQAFQYRGLAYMNLKHDDKAHRDFSQSIALDSTVAATFRYRGHVYWLQNNNSQAIADLTKALELKPDYDIAAYFRGCAYFDEEMYQEAIPDLERALLLPESKYHDFILNATTRLTEARQIVGAEPQEEGISNPTAAKHVARKKAAAQWHAKPVEKKSLSEPEHTVFSGDAPCPKCKTVIWVEWQNITVKMACPKCGFRFDHDEAIAFLSAHNPDDNYKAEEAAAAVEAVDVLEQAKALLASHEAASEVVEDEGEVEPDPFDMICPHCLTEYRARLHVGETTRCDKCLEDFVVCKHIGEVSSGVLEGLNPLSWFASENCPQCRSAAVKLGKGERFSPSGSALTYVTPWYYLCNKCRITWQRHRTF
jgi:tetratricopeptide (TPR) repeat protein